jgi:hypothetical protein
MGNNDSKHELQTNDLQTNDLQTNDQSTVELQTHPGGVRIDPSIHINKNINITYDSGTIFKDGIVRFILNDGSEYVYKSEFVEDELYDLYDMISNNDTKCLYVDSAKQFTFNCPQFAEKILFDIEIDHCQSLSTLDNKYIGAIDDPGIRIYGCPCIRSEKQIDIMNFNTNTLCLDFSQYICTPDKPTQIVTEFCNLHPNYRKMLSRINSNYNQYIGKNAMTRLNELNKAYQVLCFINAHSTFVISKRNGHYMTQYTTYNGTIGGMKTTFRPIQ